MPRTFGQFTAEWAIRETLRLMGTAFPFSIAIPCMLGYVYKAFGRADPHTLLNLGSIGICRDGMDFNSILVPEALSSPLLVPMGANSYAMISIHIRLIG